MSAVLAHHPVDRLPLPAPLSSAPRRVRMSARSMILLVALHAAYIFRSPRSGDSTSQALTFVLGLAFFLARFGRVQFFLPFVIPSRCVFPLENGVPGLFRAEWCNSQGLSGDGSAIHRANGLFPLEPAFHSHYLAVSIGMAFLPRRPSRLKALLPTRWFSRRPWEPAIPPIINH